MIHFYVDVVLNSTYASLPRAIEERYKILSELIIKIWVSVIEPSGTYVHVDECIIEEFITTEFINLVSVYDNLFANVNVYTVCIVKSY